VRLFVTDPQSLSHLITVHQLRAAGALDCPDWMRKSLGPPPKKMRDLFSDLSDEEETTADDELIPDEDEEPDGA
jgi:hypothetical protein